MATTNPIPEEILIVGAGVFGLSTALSFLEREAYNDSKITIIDSAKVLPNPAGSSVDASRIIRADYANPHYAKMACLAQEHWRDQTPSGWGGEGRYSQTGFVLTAEEGQAEYVRSAMVNVQDLAKAGLPMELDKIQELNGRDEIRKATGYPGVSGQKGYANWNSGWADAEKCVAFALKQVKEHRNGRGRVQIMSGCEVARLSFSSDGQCSGVVLRCDSEIKADLTVLATGAWTPSLFNLQNRCLATGQVLAYLKVSEAEQKYLENTPVYMNFARGTFVIPPQGRELKVARHGFGYRNPATVEHLSTKSNAERFSKHAVSVPRTDTQIPIEAEVALRVALKELFPPDADDASLAPDCPASVRTISARPFVNTRLCWYTDTPSGDFLIDWAPIQNNRSLFLATGGSGHGFKFLPVLGEYIVDAIEGHLDPAYKELWTWPTDEKLQQEHGLCKPDQKSIDIVPRGSGELEAFLECKDGSRGGPRGMLLEQELKMGTAALQAPSAKL